MKKMNKILSFLLLALTAFVFVGCGGGNKPTDGAIHIRYWHANGAELTTVLEKIKAEFEKKYEEKYVVDLTSYGDYTTLRDTIAGSIAAGDAPTAAQTYPDHVSLYLEGAALVSLDKYINDPEYGMSKEEQAQFIDGFWNEGTIYDAAGTRYAMPFNKSTELMYYNKDIFTKYGWNVPTTWDEVIDICEKFKQTTEYQKAVTDYDGLVYGLGYDSEANLFITFTQQYGATYTSFDAQGNGIYNAFGANAADTAKSKEALSWYYTQYQNKNIATTTAFGANYCSDAFKNGQCIMTIGSSAGASYNDGQNSTTTKFTTGVSAVPQLNTENGQVIQQGTNVSLFECATAEEELGGWLWLKHMVSYESALTWATETSYFPIRKDVINSKKYQNHINGVIEIEAADGTVTEMPGEPTLRAQAKKAGLAQQNWFYTNIAFPGSSKARDKAETMVQRLLYGSDQPTIDQVYQEAYDSIMNN